MKRALLIGNDRQFLLDLKSALPLAGYQPVASTENGLDALRLVHRFEPDIVFMSWNIQGFMASDLLESLLSQYLCPIIVGISQADLNLLPEIVKLNPNDIIVHPFRAIDLVTAIFCTEQRFVRQQEYNNTLEQLQNELKTRKIIYQALLILIQKRGYDEEVAYSKLREQAMAKRKTIKFVASEILKGIWLPDE